MQKMPELRARRTIFQIKIEANQKRKILVGGEFKNEIA